MPVRLAACEPCRMAKLSCDHAKPRCRRCIKAGDDRDCIYRDRPFKRKRQRALNKPHVTARISLDVGGSSATRCLPKPADRIHSYPNPGFLGTSSHEAIFQHVSPSYRSGTTPIHPGAQKSGSAQRIASSGAAQMSSWGEILREICEAPLSAYRALIQVWLSTCANFALAASLVAPCAESVLEIFESKHLSDTDVVRLSQKLSDESCSALDVDGAATLDSFTASFCASRCRWETLGLFFAALSRATLDVACFRPLYDARRERIAIRHFAMRLADSCLDIALSLDCLNDLQLMLQYECFILHSHIDGDQSYHSWRRLGDVISSLLALGYHECIGKEADTPSFLRDLRSAAFARAYSADKNVSIFLGRPPRLHRKFACLRVQEASSEVRSMEPNFAGNCWDVASSCNKGYNQNVETTWSAICAWLKERVLDLRRDQEAELKHSRAKAIASEASLQWLALPLRYRLETPLRACNQKPIERDFMVSARLNYLHVLFLLRMSLLKRLDQPDEELTSLAVSMLSLAVEAMVLRDQLTNSGTGHIWRVRFDANLSEARSNAHQMAHYGLPAAGILCLMLSSKTYALNNAEVTMSNVVQDLRTLVAHVDTGALVHPEEPDYALFVGATRCITSVLQSTATDRILIPSAATTIAQDDTEWMSWMTGADLQDFELDFWNTLSEHLPQLEASESS